jgi:hypothetical protein
VATYLQLCNRLRLEAAVSGSDMTDVEDQTGENQRMATWVAQGWQDLQNERPNWDFMKSSQLLGQGVSFATVSGQAEYELGTGPGTVGVTADDFGSWVPRSFRDQTTASGVQDQIPLAWLSYAAWRDAYAMGAQQSVTTRPAAIAVGPNNSILVGPYPTATYTLTGDYYRAPNVMEESADTPLYLPVQFQIGIVWRALWHYGMYEGAPEAVARGDKMYRSVLRQLGNLRGGMITAGRTLA